MRKDRMTRTLAPALLAALLWIPSGPAGAVGFAEEGEPIDLVIALDTSGTMRELIDSARVKIWEIVNDLAVAEPTPDLRVGLVTYGNQSGSPASGWVRIEADLTDDLDLISERLFALRSRGANEYVARALQKAIHGLSWSDSERALKFLFLAGNEPPDQDPLVRYEDMSEAARQAGIQVSAVFCGRAESDDAIGWKAMAELAQGHFAAIDHKLPALMAPTPVDPQLVELGDLMNETYVPYGDEGKSRRKSRAREDKNARKSGSAVAATRAITKASPVYTTAGDLVAAHASGAVDVLSLPASELPRSLRGMTPEERLTFVQEMSEIRDELRERIDELSAERREYVASRGPTSRAFDQVVRSRIREQARQAGYDFPEE